MKIFRLLLRVAVGVLFFGHGTQKLLGWFDGHGLKATADGFEKMGMRPGTVNAVAAGVGEAGGGALLTLGYMTPLAGASIVAVMATAIHKVHLKNGPWVSQGGYEYNLVLVLAVLALVEAGPGPVSLDAIKGKERQGTLWALASALLGAAGSAAAHFAAAAIGPPADTPADTPADPA
jgi:putative oxidoreductase